MQSLGRFLIYIKWEIEEMKCFFTHQHSNSQKSHFSSNNTRVFCSQSFPFWRWQTKLVTACDFEAAHHWYFHQQLPFKLLQKCSLKAWSVTQLSSVLPPGGILAWFHLGSRELSWVVPQKLGSLDQKRPVCYVLLLKWWLGWGLS